MNCNCENAHCGHGEKPCKEPAGAGTIECIGNVCDPCWRSYPERYQRTAPRTAPQALDDARAFDLGGEG